MVSKQIKFNSNQINTHSIFFLETKARPASVFDLSVFAKAAAPQPLPENDLYAALRGIPSPVVHVPKEEPKEEIKETAFSENDEDEDDPWQGKLFNKKRLLYFLNFLQIYNNRILFIFFC
jgi:hypothetical protein